MDAKVSELIRAFSASAGAAVSGINYASLFGAKARFSILPQRLPDFLSEYATLAEADEAAEEDNAENHQRLGMSIGEVASSKYVPIMVTMCFRFHLSAEEREEPSLYGEDFIKANVNALQELMAEQLQLSPQMSELICTVQESSVWHQGENTFVRVRFQCPYAKVDIGYQQKTFRPLFMKLVRQRKIISRMEVQPVGDWDVIIEPISDVVALYRSKDESTQCPLKLTHIYEYISADKIEALDAKELELANVFKPMHHSFIHSGQISNTFLAKEVDIKHWLPLFLSINFWAGVVNPKISEPVGMGSGGMGGSIEYEEAGDDKDPVRITRQLLPLLNADRANVEIYWHDVGRICNKLTNGGEEGFDMFASFSSRATVLGRDKEACATVYPRLRDGTLDEKTIGFYARIDSPEGYKEWHSNWCQSALSQALSLSHDDVSEALYRVFWLDYMCAGMTKNSWYKFTGVQLKMMDDAIWLRKDITEKFIPLYKQMRANLSQQSVSLSAKQAEHKQVEMVVKQYTNLISKLGNQGYKTSLISMCKEKFYVDQFDKIRDSDPNKTGWANCVIECCGNTAYPRPGKPQDYITKNTYCRYRSDLSWEHPLVVELMTWFKQCFPDDALLRYVLKDWASYLLGRNAEKLFRVWSGAGDNSKSMVVKLLQACLGSYAIDFPAELVMKSFAKGSSGPTPELAQAQGAHTGLIAEPDSDGDLDAGKIKRFTGGDRFFARLLHENGASLEAFFKLIYMCNRIPNIPGADKALRNRFLYVPFLSTWVLNGAPETPEEQMKARVFKMDPFFEKRIPELAEAMSWVMVQYYTTYREEGLVPPQIIQEYTERHWQENDPFLIFIHERIVHAFKGADNKEIDLTVTKSATDLYGPFKTWFKDAYPGAQVPTQPRFKAEMMQTSRLGPQNGRSQWLGIRLREIQLAAVPTLGHQG
ncbi:D5 DNA Primase [uncultured virus]|nr:D5 DNA Primase [uncultured virus]